MAKSLPGTQKNNFGISEPTLALENLKAQVLLDEDPAKFSTGQNFLECYSLCYWLGNEQKLRKLISCSLALTSTIVYLCDERFDKLLEEKKVMGFTKRGE